MEENNRPVPNTEESAQNHQNHENGENRNRRHRGHRGGRKHGRDRDKKAFENNDTVTSFSDIPEEKAAEALLADEKQQKPHRAGGGHTDKKHEDKKHDRRDKKQRGPRDGQKNREHFHQKDDIYGDPNEEKELAEWRAKIVLNAAEPLPTPPAEEKTPAPFEPEEESAEIEIPENVDLFESPILSAPAQETPAEQVEVIGVRFRSGGKMYYFDPQKTQVEKGDFAIVETARGPEFGEICLANTMIAVNDTISPLRPLIRVATPADVLHNEENQAKEKEALVICQQKIEHHKLDMKLIDAQYAFDNSKLLFYFSSEGRVDFRELVKDLASVFRTRIELRQIGIRDEAKMLGGIGACGRALCCSTFLPDFAQVSIKMAKEQGLSLNSAKISGVCGRLMCCLRFESEVYSEEIRLTPSNDTLVKTEDGIGTVISSNPLAGTVRVVLKDSPDIPPKQYHRDAITVLGKNKRQKEDSTPESNG